MENVRENIFVMENGTILEITEETAQVVGQVASANVFVDGTVVGDVGPHVMAEREILSRDGFVIAVVPVSPATGEVSGKPELVSRGFIYAPENKELIKHAAERAHAALRSGGSRRRQAIIETTQGILGRFFYEETGRETDGRGGRDTNVTRYDAPEFDPARRTSKPHISVIPPL